MQNAAPTPRREKQTPVAMVYPDDSIISRNAMTFIPTKTKPHPTVFADSSPSVPSLDSPVSSFLVEPRHPSIQSQVKADFELYNHKALTLALTQCKPVCCMGSLQLSIQPHSATFARRVLLFPFPSAALLPSPPKLGHHLDWQDGLSLACYHVSQLCFSRCCFHFRVSYCANATSWAYCTWSHCLTQCH
jgi:hypothetical protein